MAKLGSVKLPLGEDMKYFGAIVCLFAGMPPSAYAQEPGAVPVPQEVSALAGCWQGTGSVMGKPVSITLAAKPITEGALFLVEADSHAVTDPADRYAAHLIFGGKAAVDGKPGGISAFFADSFGGDFTSVGTGSANASGFEVAYVYPDATFVNRWTVAPASASWTIVMKDEAGEETTFASYDLRRKQCAPSPTT
ncbi:MAG: hypothetical protein ACK4MY_16150 [Brevundimonas sp.]